MSASQAARFRKGLRNPRIGIPVAVVAMIVALVTIVVTAGSSRPTPHDWYWDLGKGELFTAETRQWPPIKAPSGGEGVRAIVMSCDDCADEDKRFVGYLQTFSKEVQSLIGVQTMEASNKVADGSMVKTTESTNWVTMNSEAGAAITLAAMKRCEGKGKLAVCQPRP